MVDSARDASAQELFGRKSLDQLNAERPLADVFFDLDTPVIREDAKALLVANANWARTWESTMLTIEGYCDERGSSEYNLALGSRRADAVKSYMVGLGVSASRIALVSKGKEQGFCSDDNEGCWQQNRRGHFLVTAK
jgi:peptidoglycan-associated lipoprotein